MTGNNITLRQRKKALTRQKVLAAARDLFTERDYHSVTIRELAKAFGMSTSAIFNNFTGKEQLFTEAMGFPPPVDGPLTRAAPMLLEAVQTFAEWLAREDAGPDYEGMTRDTHPTGEAIWRKWFYDNIDICGKSQDQARAAIALATSPLDGEVWARHLESIRRDVPHDCRAEQPAASQPSDAAGDQ